MLTQPKFSRMFFSVIVILTLTLSNFSPSPARAQGGDDGIKRQVNAQSGRVSFIGPESGGALPASEALGAFSQPQDPALALAKRFAPEFGLQNPERDLTELKTHRADDGRVTARYQQTYQGIPVMGGELIVNTNEDGDLYSMNGEVSPDLSLPTQPTIDSVQAAETALQAMAKWYQKTPADFVATKPELWIFDESLLKQSARPAELVWRMEVTPKDNAMPVRELVLVNAERGNISLHFNQIDTAWGANTITEQNPQPILSTTASSSTIEPRTKNIVKDNLPALTGGVWYVATTGDDANDCAAPSTPCATINGAIGKAMDGDTIKVAIGTYAGTGYQVVYVNKSIFLSGGWDASFTTQSGMSTIDGQNVRRGMSVNGGVTTTIDRFNVKNGRENFGGGIYNYGNLTITNSYVQSNSAVHGGGIYNGCCDSLTMNNTTISNNSASNNGGGIYNWGNLTLNNSTVSDNSAALEGGGIYNLESLTLNNSTLSDNSADNGGGMENYSGIATLNNTTISSNLASYNGGGIYSFGGTTSLKNSMVGANSSGGRDRIVLARSLQAVIILLAILLIAT